MADGRERSLEYECPIGRPAGAGRPEQDQSGGHPATDLDNQLTAGGEPRVQGTLRRLPRRADGGAEPSPVPAVQQFTESDVGTAGQ